MTRFFPSFRLGKTFLLPLRRESRAPAPPAVHSFTSKANARARAANRARGKRARAARRINR